MIDYDKEHICESEVITSR